MLADNPEEGILAVRRYVEARLRAIRQLKLYKTNCLRLERLQELLSVREHEYSLSAQIIGGTRPSIGTYSDPVAVRFSQLERLRSIVSNLEQRVYPLREVYNFLKVSSSEEERQMFLVFERHYINGEGITAISADIGQSERTLYRRREELTSLVQSKLEEGDSV